MDKVIKVLSEITEILCNGTKFRDECPETSEYPRACENCRIKEVEGLIHALEAEQEG